MHLVLGLLAVLFAVTACKSDNDVGDLRYHTRDPGSESGPVSITIDAAPLLQTRENGDAITIPVVLDKQPNHIVTVRAELSDASEGELDSATLEFNVGNFDTAQNLVLRPVDDAIQDGNQSYTLTISTESEDGRYNALSAETFPVVNRDDDTVGWLVTASASSLVLEEDSGTETLTVRLNTAPSDTVRVLVRSSDTSEVLLSGGGSSDAQEVALSFSASNWDTAQTVVLDAVDDGLADGNQTITVQARIDTAGTADETGYAMVPAQTFSVTVVDEDSVGLTVVASDDNTTFLESGVGVGGMDDFTVRLNSLPNGPVVVRITNPDTTELTMSAPDNDSASAVTLTFTASDWSTPQTVTLTGVNDALSDGPVEVTLNIAVSPAFTLDTTGYVGLSAETLLATVVDDDSAGFLVTESGGTTELSEDGDSDSFTVVLTSQPYTSGGPGSIEMTVTSSDTTEAVLTYGGQSQQASITIDFDSSNWSTPQTVFVVGPAEFLDDGDQDITVQVAVTDTTDDETGFADLSAENVDVTVVDNDTAGILVQQDGGSTTMSEGGTDELRIRLTSQPESLVVVSVDCECTAATAGTEQPPGAVEATLSDDDESGGTSVSLFFTGANWSTAQEVVVHGVDDDVADGEANVAIGFSIDEGSTTDTGYLDVASAIAAETDDIIAQVSDNDSPALVITETGGSTVFTEDGVDTDTFTIRLASEPYNSGGAAAVEVQVFSPNSSKAVLTDGDETKLDTILLTFTDADWATPQTVTVQSPADDDINAANVELDLQITIAGGTAETTGYAGLSMETLAVEVEDDDSVGLTITESGGSTTVNEVGAPTSDSFDFHLTSQPWNGTDGDVVIAVTHSDTSEFVISGGDAEFSGENSDTLQKFRFTFEDWQTDRTVTITPVDEDIDDGNQGVNITLDDTTGTTDTSGYTSMGSRTVGVTVVDNDTAGVTVAQTGGTTITTELGATDTFTVKLNSEPTANVTVTVASQNTDEVLVDVAPLGTPASSKVLTFTNANWNVTQTVQVEGQDEVIDDGDQDISVTFTLDSSDAKYDEFAVTPVTVTNQDNDVSDVSVVEVDTDITEDGDDDGSITLVLNTEPVGTVEITVSSNDTGEVLITNGVAAAASSFAFTFNNTNWSDPQTVVLRGADEYIDDGNQTANVSISIDITGEDSTGYLTSLSIDDVTLDVVQDNDTANLTVIADNPIQIDEDGDSDTFTVRLATQPVGDVEVTVTSNDTSEAVLTYGGQTAQSAITIDFDDTNWNTNQTVQVVGVTEYIADPTQNFTATVAVTDTPDAGDTVYDGKSETVNIQVVDNDDPGVTTNDGDGLSLAEDGGTDTFTVRLDSEPLGGEQVVVDITSGATDEAVLSYGGQSLQETVQIVFTNANWNTPQTVTVTGVAEAVVDGPQVFSITLAIDAETVTDPEETTDTTGYLDISSIPALSVTVTDNDSLGVTVTDACATVVSEQGGTGTYTIRLTSQPLDDVAIDIDSDSSVLNVSGDGQSAAQSITIDFDDTDWSTPVTITVTGANPDAADNGSQAVTVSHTINETSTLDTSGYDDAGLAIASVAVTVVDDDGPYIIVTENNCATSVDEDGTPNDTISVRLSRPPTTTVDVLVTSTDTTEALVVYGGSGEVSEVTIPFTSANWNTPQDVTIEGQDDDIDDGNQSITLDFSVDTSDGGRDTSFDASTNNLSVTVRDDDTKGITFSQVGGGSTQVAETASSDTVSVQLNSEPDGIARIIVETLDTSEAELDYSAQNGSSIFIDFDDTNWDVAQIVTVTGLDDSFADGTQAYTLRARVDTGNTSAVEYQSGVSNQTLAASTTDDESAAIVVTNDGLTLTEGGGTDTISVELGTPVTDVDVTVTSQDGSEARLSYGGQNDQTSVVISFNSGNWSTGQVITVTPQQDDVADGSQVFNLTFAVSENDGADDDAYTGVTAPNESVTVNDDDMADVSITESAGDTEVEEDGGTDTIDIDFSSEPTDDVIITVASENARVLLTYGGQVEQTSVDVTITSADWETTKTVTVVGADDDVADGFADIDVNFEITDADSSGYDLGVLGTVSARVTDNDTIGVTVANAGPGDVQVNEDADGSDSFSIRLNSEPDGDVVMDVASTDTGEVLLTYGGQVQLGTVTITFDDTNWATPQVVTVVGAPEDQVDGNQTVDVTLTIDDASSSETTGYEGIDDIADVEVTVLDNDSVGMTVVESGGSTSLSENGGVDTFTIRLNSEPFDDVVITVSHADPSELALSGGTGTDTVRSFTFDDSNWETPQTVTLTGQDEFDIDGSQPVEITVAIDTGGTLDDAYDVVSPQSFDATVTDDDTAGITLTGASGKTVSEAGDTDSFDIKLDTLPTGDVVVVVNVPAMYQDEADLSSGAQLNQSSVTLTFTTADWSTNQTVTITGLDEDFADGNVSFNLTLMVDNAATTGDEYDDYALPNVGVTVTDDDSANVTVTLTGGTTVVAESAPGTTDTFTIELTSQPDTEVDVDVTSPFGTEVLLSDGDEFNQATVTLTFGAGDWDTPQTVTVTGQPDYVVDGNQDFNLTWEAFESPGDTGYDGDSGTVAVTVQDVDEVGFTIPELAGGLRVCESSVVDACPSDANTATFTVVLNTVPDGDVVFSVTSPEPTEALVSDMADETTPAASISLVFNAGNWNTPQTVTVTGEDEAANDGNQNFLVTIEVDGGSTTDSTGYTDIFGEAISVTVVDDE